MISLRDLVIVETCLWVIKSRRMRWAGHIACMGSGEVFTGLWLGRLKGKRPVGRRMHRWEDNIKMDLREIEIEVNWIWLAQDRVQWQLFMNTAMDRWVS